ncbi:unnamed protein product [Pleuronectes platessa]|uniref:Uncharacterized protein n=1 Tax=Pleuronectes platessa TaxID=8262 RepID=A0A9N7ZEB4_PLEPL|nr:unnamed protein product [Pleuronectes platessa]
MGDIVVYEERSVIGRTPQQRQNRRGRGAADPGGQAGVSVCPIWTPRQHGVQIGDALLRGGQPRVCAGNNTGRHFASMFSVDPLRPQWVYRGDDFDFASAPRQSLNVTSVLYSELSTWDQIIQDDQVSDIWAIAVIDGFFKAL